MNINEEENNRNAQNISITIGTYHRVISHRVGHLSGKLDLLRG
jgi:fatty-acid desaturase